MATVAPLQELIGDDADQIGLLYWRIVPRAATVRGQSTRSMPGTLNLDSSSSTRG